jgi:hypothetical protein
MQDFGLFDHSSHQKPHFVQPLSISPIATTLATMVSRLNTPNLMLRPTIGHQTKARERQKR